MGGDSKEKKIASTIHSVIGERADEEGDLFRPSRSPLGSHKEAACYYGTMSERGTVEGPLATSGSQVCPVGFCLHLARA